MERREVRPERVVGFSRKSLWEFEPDWDELLGMLGGAGPEPPPPPQVTEVRGWPTPRQPAPRR